MTYNFPERRDYLRTRMREVNQVTINYIRSESEALIGIVATCFEIQAETLLAFGVALDIRVRDYIIDYSVLAALPQDSSDAGMSAIEPQQGDQIEDISNGIVCRVVPLGAIEPCFHYTGQLRRAFRIHTEVTKFPEVFDD